MTKHFVNKSQTTLKNTEYDFVDHYNDEFIGAMLEKSIYFRCRNLFFALFYKASLLFGRTSAGIVCFFWGSFGAIEGTIYYYGESSFGTCNKFYKYESSLSLGELRRDRVFCGFCDTIYTILRLTKKLGGGGSPMIKKINSLLGSDNGFVWSVPQIILAQI